ncbi:MAG: methyltransferase domain-containing protein [Sphingobacteriales bacterium]|nr:methyltransferase domain-containing protein [Sphingobacteriales bacterium]MCC7224526.1 methyltransferase domain-containing protein [Chitinophagales bacterium]
MDKPKNSSELSQSYWNIRWENSETGWDIGYASPAIVEYMAQYPNKDANILIPGCGNAYEAESLLANGFQHITLIDIAPKAVEVLKAKFVDKPQVKILCEDFFQHQSAYDLIIEQTFFCAISPDQRIAYAQKMASLLRPKGKIIGLLFDIVFEKQGPPFGGCADDYRAIFEPYFVIQTMEKCHNSISPRAGTELFIKLSKK